MTQQPEVAGGRDVIARWCTLAEQRLEYLTELFESGRWRRFHSERAFLENIEEAKAAVETWRDLSSREACRNNRAIDKSWLRRATSRGKVWRDPLDLPKLVAQSESPLNSAIAEISSALGKETPSVQLLDENRTELPQRRATFSERYPLLRNRF